MKVKKWKREDKKNESMKIKKKKNESTNYNIKNIMCDT